MSFERGVDGKSEMVGEMPQGEASRSEQKRDLIALTTWLSKSA